MMMMMMSAMSRSEMAVLIEMPFGLWTQMGPRKHILDGVQWAPQDGGQFRSTLCLKKVPTFRLSVTLSDLNRFSEFLHCWKALLLITGWMFIGISDVNYGCDEVRIRIWRCSNFKRFQNIWNSSSVSNTVLSTVNSWESACSTSNFMCIKQTASKMITKWI